MSGDKSTCSFGVELLGRANKLIRSKIRDGSKPLLGRDVGGLGVCIYGSEVCDRAGLAKFKEMIVNIKESNHIGESRIRIFSKEN